MFRRLASLVFLALSMMACSANEAEIGRAIEEKFKIKVDSVTKSGYLNLYEVYADGHIFYTDAKLTAMIIGGDLVGAANDVNLIDLKTRQNVTEARLAKLKSIPFAELQLDHAVKQVRGDGKRVLAVFEDPNCGFCKRLARELVKLDNVTIYIFLYPILSEDSLRKSRQIWCSADRVKAWHDWMVEDKPPTGRDNCDATAISRNREFGRKYNISGTPTMIFASGERIPGAASLEVIERHLGAPAR